MLDDIISILPHNDNPEVMRRVEVYTRRVASGQDIWTGERLPDDVIEDLEYLAEHRSKTINYYRSVGRSRL